MNVNPLIENALLNIGCPVDVAYHEGREDTYIVYYTLLENPDLYADDEEQEETTYITITIYSKVDYKQLVKEIKNRMKQAGFTHRSGGPESYDSGYVIYPIEFYIEEMEDER